MVKDTAVSTSCNTKSHKKSCDKKGSRVIKSRCLQICNEKCWQSAWDYWKCIAANRGQYRSEFATSKMPRIRVVCVISIKKKPIDWKESEKEAKEGLS